jgi:transcriptional regulator with XRE-family HTH domain
MSGTRADRDPPAGHLLTYPRGGPTVVRILLGTQLRRLREARGISTDAAAHPIRASHSKISRMELGRVGFKERDVEDLLTLYGVTDLSERSALLALARRANTPGWWQHYNDLLPAWFEPYIGLEEAASLIRTYEVQFVPGLLQTEDYARAVIRLAHFDTPEEDIERRVRLRMTRQRRLTAPDAPTVWAVVDEGALRRPVGGAEVIRGQVDRLIELTELPNVTLQIVPFDTGGHAAAGGPFTLLRFSEPTLSDVVYMEQLTSALYLEKPHDVDTYLDVMNRLCVEAVRPEDTVARLAAIRAEL